METPGYFEDVKEMFRETDRKMEETDRKVADAVTAVHEMSRRVSEVSTQLGGLGNRLGEFVEWVIKPGLVRVFRERGLDVHQVFRDIEVRRGVEGMQVDLLVVNDIEAVAVEVKSKLLVSDVDEHLERLRKFKRMSPQYASLKLYGAVAAMVLSDDVVNYAQKKGLFVIGHRGDDATIVNDLDFSPAEY